MDPNFPVWGNMMAFRSIESEALQEPAHPVNQRRLDPFSHQTLLASPRRGSKSFNFGVDTAQQLDQTAGWSVGDRDMGLNNSLGSNQWMRDAEKLIVQAPAGENTELQWQRIKWTDNMVRDLIKVVSYVVKALSEFERRQMFVPVKGKWRAVSIAMAEKGYFISPQQCEDKFNDVNRKYKRLTDILGRVACDVMQEPALLDSVHIANEAKDEVRKIMSCKQLFYQEMCSFHNWNQRYLPYDPSLEQAVIYALTGKARPKPPNVNLEVPAKRQKQANYSRAHGVDAAQNTETAAAVPEAVKKHDMINQRILARKLKLKEKGQEIQKQLLEVEKKRIEFLQFRQKQNRELQKIKAENKLMKLENERLLIELEQRGLSNNDE